MLPAKCIVTYTVQLFHSEHLLEVGAVMEKLRKACVLDGA